jgi:hypothetical protein
MHKIISNFFSVLKIQKLLSLNGNQMIGEVHKEEEEEEGGGFQ